MFYILDENKNSIKVDMLEWASFFNDINNRIVEKTKVGELEVSTVFLGLDHSFDYGIPLLFETMVFDSNDKPVQFDELSELQIAMRELIGIDFGCNKRYATFTDAQEGHNEIVERLKLFAEDKK